MLAESRGGKEDRLLKESYHLVYQRGLLMPKAAFFQSALASCELKLKLKSANIAGLQLADLLVHPARQGILWEKQRIEEAPSRFVQQLLETVEGKFNRHPPESTSPTVRKRPATTRWGNSGAIPGANLGQLPISASSGFNAAQANYNTTQHIYG